ncbi:MAG: ATP-dependent DNA helicase RecG [Thermodesulfovibrionales bacterium]
MDSNLSEVLIHCAKGVGPKRAKLLGEIGITSLKDSFYYLPYRYEDRSAADNILTIKEGRPETVRGKVIAAGAKASRGSRPGIFTITVSDGTASVKARWFNQPFMKKNLPDGCEVLLSGEVKRDRDAGWLFFDNPEYEIVGAEGDSLIHSDRIVPVYRLTEGMSQKQLRKIMFGIVEKYAGDIVDPMPEDIIRRHNLPPLRESIKQLHFPADGCDTDSLNRRESKYHKRLAFDEFFTFELGVAAIRKNKKREKGRAIRCQGMLQRRLIEKLPYALTGDQKRVLDEIVRDMAAVYPMQRLLQGDVGCGKTIVALMAMLHAVEYGCQTAFMAPTEILAEQHFYTLCNAVEDLGVKAVLAAGGAKEIPLDMISSGEAAVVVGTHALIQEGVRFKDLGLVVIDEQHKFGVTQRGILRKKGKSPDVLVMTATPIPRSLALTLYGDMDYSIINEMPSGRKPILTEVFLPSRKAAIYGIMEGEIRKGRQVYVVYPVIEESEKADLKSAVEGCKAFRKIFPEFRIGLLHGRMSPSDKRAAMMSFKNGETRILISTTVVEVGVDVPNATVMVIVHAERFGLAQLHQLRGRVGRGGELSHCLLIGYEPLGEDARRRLDVMVRTSDGFKIAEEDLDIRGPGQFFGTRQAGLPDFKAADPARDLRLLEAARREAFDLIDTKQGIDQFPLLRKSFESFWLGKTDCYQTV